MDERVDVLLRPWGRNPPRRADDDRVLFVGAQPHRDLVALAGPHVVAVQPWRPHAVVLEALGHEVHTALPAGDGGFAAALVLPERQREAAQAALGAAWLALRDGGELVACAPVREGGKRLVDDLRALVGGAVQVDVKARCRVTWARRRGEQGVEVAQAWVDAGAPRQGPDGRWTAPGLFAWDRVDAGTAMLRDALPKGVTGRVADAGSGTGVLADRVLATSPGEAEVHLLEADARALDLSVRTLTAAHPGRVVRPHWVDATVRWPVRDLDAVVMNPPFHEAGSTDVGLGEAMITRAAEALAPGGVCWLVANYQLPYERVLREAFSSGAVVREQRGYKVIRAVR